MFPDNFLTYLSFSRLRVTFHAAKPILLPVFKGSTFRGCFGQALKRQVCRYKRKPCEQCQLKYECSFSVLFNSFALPNNDNDDKKVAKQPHPYIIVPFSNHKTYFTEGDSFGFELTLIGNANSHVNNVLSAITAMGDIGLGKEHKKFRAVSLEVLNTDLVYENLGYLSRIPLIGYSHLPVVAANEKLCLTLQTPLRLSKDSKPYFDVPEFGHFIDILLNRLMQLAVLYGDADDTIFEQKAQWMEGAEHISVKMPDREFSNQTRFSGTQNTKMKFDGILGNMLLEGNELNKWIPLLVMGSWLHVGSTTTFGLGKYTLM